MVSSLLAAILVFVAVACLLLATATGIMVFLLIKQLRLERSRTTDGRSGSTNWLTDLASHASDTAAGVDIRSRDADDGKPIGVPPVQAVDDVDVPDRRADGSVAPGAKGSERRPRRDYEVVSPTAVSDSGLAVPDPAHDDDGEDAKPPVPPKCWSAGDEPRSEASKEPAEATAPASFCVGVPEPRDASDGYCRVVKIRESGDRPAGRRRPKTDCHNPLTRAYSLGRGRIRTSAYWAVEPDPEQRDRKRRSAPDCDDEPRRQGSPTEVAATAGNSRSEAEEAAPVVPPRKIKPIDR